MLKNLLKIALKTSTKCEKGRKASQYHLKQIWRGKISVLSLKYYFCTLAITQRSILRNDYMDNKRWITLTEIILVVALFAFVGYGMYLGTKGQDAFNTLVYEDGPVENLTALFLFAISGKPEKEAELEA